jgi:hypothetical protein
MFDWIIKNQLTCILSLLVKGVDYISQSNLDRSGLQIMSLSI